LRIWNRLPPIPLTRKKLFLQRKKPPLIRAKPPLTRKKLFPRRKKSSRIRAKLPLTRAKLSLRRKKFPLIRKKLSPRREIDVSRRKTCHPGLWNWATGPRHRVLERAVLYKNYTKKGLGMVKNWIYNKGIIIGWGKK
jgi:hypothetical protein